MFMFKSQIKTLEKQLTMEEGLLKNEKSAHDKTKKNYELSQRHQA